MVKTHLRPAIASDADAAFLYHLAMQWNGQVSEVLGPRPIPELLNLVMSLYAKLLDAGSTPQPAEVATFNRMLMQCLEEVPVLQSAINRICDDHFLGHRVLFADAEERLANRRRNSEILLCNYNLLASDLGLEKLALSQVEVSMSAQANAKYQALISLAWARAYQTLGRSFAADSVIFPFLESGSTL